MNAHIIDIFDKIDFTLFKPRHLLPDAMLQSATEAETALKAALASYAVIEGPERTKNSFYLSRLANLAGRKQRFAEAEL
jgi:hypothetical protein